MSANKTTVNIAEIISLSAAGLSSPEVTLAYHALIEYVVESAAIDTAGTSGSPEDVEARHRLWRAAYFAASPAEFPHTTRLAPLLYPSLDEQFAFGIDVLSARTPPARTVNG